ncbi:enoyl-CoA hydratase/isomerase family protein [Glaciecola sp. SC05]|uniref:enoyl-CoA hydratase/isomerase family protein n=1 Tax=Glaciecola sp. SC05 TaxID=1987355 RepID=UPI00352994E9
MECSALNYLNLSENDSSYINSYFKNAVVTITMNKPKKLNGWTSPMMEAFANAFDKAREDASSKVVIFTGVGEYYSAGVNLGGTLKLMAPKKLHKLIVEHNEILFERFLSFPKPILIATNGPAIGASVTSATLCDAIIASDTSTYSTPFAALGITPEGCSSIQFARLMGEENAQRMLGPEGWRPTAEEALAAGLVQWVVPKDKLQQEAQKIAEQWVADERARTYMGNSQLPELQAANARESIELADCFLGAKFLKGQHKFLWSKNKRMPALVFLSLWALRPLWRHFL